MKRMVYLASQVDRRYNDWHYSLDANAKYMDLDGIEFILGRSDPILAFIETTYVRTKATTITRYIATKVNAPAWVVQVPPPPEVQICPCCGRPGPYPPFDGSEIIAVRRIWHPEGLRDWREATLRVWGRFLESLRDKR